LEFSFRHFLLGGGPGADPKLTGGIIYPLCPGNALGSPGRSWRVLLWRGMSGTCLPLTFSLRFRSCGSEAGDPKTPKVVFFSVFQAELPFRFIVKAMDRQVALCGPP